MRLLVGLSPHVLTKCPGILVALDFSRYQAILKVLLVLSRGTGIPVQSRGDFAGAFYSTSYSTNPLKLAFSTEHKPGEATLYGAAKVRAFYWLEGSRCSTAFNGGWVPWCFVLPEISWVSSSGLFCCLLSPAKCAIPYPSSRDE